MTQNIYKGIAASLVLVGLLAMPVYAEATAGAAGAAGGAPGAVSTKIETKKEEMKEKIADKKALLKTKFGRSAIGSGVLKSVSGTTLTLEKDGKTYTVLTGTFDTCTTKFLRRFWGTSAISEMTVGDKLNVVGKWQDEAKTTIEACNIRNVSIQKRFAVFMGIVKSVSANGFVMSTNSAKRTDQTVALSTKGKVTDRKEATLALSQVVVGHKVRVKGMWDNTANTVVADAIKDFSLPVLTKVSPTGGVTPTVTVLPTVKPTISAQ